MKVLAVKGGMNMKREVIALLLAGTLAFAPCCTALAATYTGTGQGMVSEVEVTLTVDEDGGMSVKLDTSGETEGIGAAAQDELEAQLNEALSSEIEGVSGATITSDAAREAMDMALAAAEGETEDPDAPLAFTPGTYTGTAEGYNADVSLAVTFSKDAIESIEIEDQAETDHVGTSAYDIMIPDIIEANGTGVDSVAGATFTSRAIRNAVNDAAMQAEVTNLSAFRSNAIELEPGDPVEDTWDIVIVGAGGAGMAAAAQAAQNGDTVLVIETNAEMGGNTLVSGGSFQAVVPYLVWDPEDPDATTGEYDGETYDKIKTDEGRLNTLKTILEWSEEPFDGTLDEDHPFVAGDVALNAKRGVHEEYLDTLLTLKEQISQYVEWADAKLAEGVKETDLTVFSTKELHLFQTYYGGLRPSADGTEWIYSTYELANQLVSEALDFKYWLIDQGAIISLDTQSTLIGCLWQRINRINGGVVDGETYGGKWGTYFKVPENTVLTADEHNEIMTRTTATGLIEEDGRIVGVTAEKFDGTPVTAYAGKGVILATGGYGANIDMVQETNIYWNEEYIADNIGTTNRSSLMGDGLVMAQEVGAAVEGMGWTQMMPLGWVDNGNLAGGTGETVIYINSATGKRYVDESAERDVLSLGAFENGMSEELADELGLKYVPGIYVELSRVSNNGDPAVETNPDLEGRRYTWTVDELAEKLHLDPDVIIDTVTEYDNYVMGVSDSLEVEKQATRGTIGVVQTDEDGNYLPDTYVLDQLTVRFMAPSTHHTMGGLVVDTERHVLDEDGEIIEGLYAAGEVCSGFHAGNRLGGNAISEILVSGRIAANTINAEAGEAPAEEEAEEEAPAEEAAAEEAPAKEAAAEEAPAEEAAAEEAPAEEAAVEEAAAEEEPAEEAAVEEAAAEEEPAEEAAVEEAAAEEEPAEEAAVEEAAEEEPAEEAAAEEAPAEEAAAEEAPAEENANN